MESHSRTHLVNERMDEATPMRSTLQKSLEVHTREVL